MAVTNRAALGVGRPSLAKDRSYPTLSDRDLAIGTSRNAILHFSPSIFMKTTCGSIIEADLC
jgi:hypothetical protein